MGKTKALMAVVILVIVMYLSAGLAGEKDIIFPEIAALSIGAWLIENSPWAAKPVYIWLSPTLAAITGVGMLHFLPYPREVLIGSVFALVILQLYLLRSQVLPAISAAILPILLNTDSWYYLGSVCVFSAIIAAGLSWLNYCRRPDGSGLELISKEKTTKKNRWQTTGINYWLKIFGGVIFATLIAGYCQWFYVIAPPLFVMFVEFANPASHIFQKPVRLWGLMVLAAVSGVFLVEVNGMLGNRALWASAACIVGGIIMLFYWFKVVFPPAAAISLLPTILPKDGLWFYPLQIAAGCLMFIIMGEIICRPLSEIRRIIKPGSFYGS